MSVGCVRGAGGRLEGGKLGGGGGWWKTGRRGRRGTGGWRGLVEGWKARKEGNWGVEGAGGRLEGGEGGEGGKQRDLG